MWQQCSNTSRALGGAGGVRAVAFVHARRPIAVTAADMALVRIGTGYHPRSPRTPAGIAPRSPAGRWRARTTSAAVTVIPLPQVRPLP